MRHSEGNSVVGWVYEDVSSHPRLIPAMPSLSHYHCCEASQIKASSYLAWRKVSAWATIRARGWHVVCLFFFCRFTHIGGKPFNIFSSRCKPSQHLSIGTSLPDLVSLYKTQACILHLSLWMLQRAFSTHRIQKISKSLVNIKTVIKIVIFLWIYSIVEPVISAIILIVICFFNLSFKDTLWWVLTIAQLQCKCGYVKNRNHKERCN